MLTNFERVKAILDILCPPIDADGKAAELIKAQLAALSSEYPRIWSPARPVVDYGTPPCHAAYIFKYLAANADLIYQSLWRAKPYSDAAFSGKSITIACVGGGPGTELVALFKYLERVKTKVEHVRCIVLDHHVDWTDTFAATAATAPSGLKVDIEFHPMTLTDPASVPTALIAQADLITFSYSLSEVWRYNAGGVVSKAVQTIFTSAKSGAVIIYSDNAGPHFDPHMVREFTEHAGLKQLDRTDYTHMLVGTDEQMNTLSGYMTWLEMRPKLTGRATTAVFVKS